MAQAQFTLAEILAATSSASRPAAKAAGSVKPADLEGVPFAILGIAKKDSRFGKGADGKPKACIVYTVSYGDGQTGDCWLSLTPEREAELRVAKQLVEASASDPVTIVRKLGQRPNSYSWHLAPYSSITG